jgi:hypothetical protein
MQPSPGQSYPGQSYPGQSYPGQVYPGQSYLGRASAGPAPSAPYFAAPATSGVYPYPMQPVQPIQPIQSMGPMMASLPQPVPAPPPLDGRRRALLTVLVYNPVMLVAYLFYLYGPSNSCVAGPFCGFGELPGLAQGMLLLLGAGLLWLLISTGIRWLLDVTPWQSRFARTLRAITEYRLVRPLFGLYGGTMVLALLIGLVTWRLSPAALILGSATAFVCLRCALGRVPAPLVPATLVAGPSRL